MCSSDIDIDISGCCCHWQSPGVAGGTGNLSAGDGADAWSENKRFSQACLPSVRCRGISALEIAAEQVSATQVVCACCLCHGSVLLRHIYDRLHRVSPGRGFLPHWKCIITRERGMGVHSAGKVCYLWLPWCVVIDSSVCGPARRPRNSSCSCLMRSRLSTVRQFTTPIVWSTCVSLLTPPRRFVNLQLVWRARATVAWLPTGTLVLYLCSNSFLFVPVILVYEYRLCLHVGNPAYNSIHSMLGSPMPTLSLKLNLTLILVLTLILTLLTLLSPTDHNCETIKSHLFLWNKSQHHRRCHVSELHCNTVHPGPDYTGHQPALGITDFLTSSIYCLYSSGSWRAYHIRFLSCRQYHKCIHVCICMCMCICI